MAQVIVTVKPTTTGNRENDLCINNFCRGVITPEQQIKFDSLTPEQKELVSKFVHQYNNFATDPFTKKIVEARNQGQGAFNKIIKDFTSAALYNSKRSSGDNPLAPLYDSKHSLVDNPFAFGQGALYS